MHNGTCVAHVPWCMSGSLTRGDGENVPGIPGACATRNVTYLARGPCLNKACPRLLHSPRLVAIGYETWPPIGWHHPFGIGWSKYRLGLPSAPLHYGLTWPVGIPTVFQTPVTVSLHRQAMPALRAVQGDCARLWACPVRVHVSENMHTVCDLLFLCVNVGGPACHHLSKDK